jgi:PAS domain S-box-containing protein
MDQIGAPLASSYDYGEVARSILIAVAASYVALDLGGRISAARGRVRNAWLTGGAIAMGVGIWAMHFKGMLALRLPVIVGYYWPAILVSLLIAALASGIALYVATRKQIGPVEAWTGSLVIGGGIAAMHYIGMAGMRLPAVMRFSPLLVTLSVVLAILFSRVALMFTFDYREDFRGSTLAKLISAAVMGGAISLMHYTGMAAVSFIPTTVLPNLSHTVSISPIGNNEIAIVTLLILGAAVVTSSVDRRTQEQILRLNERLEQRAVERTRQLEAANERLRREIAEHQRAQDALRQSEEQYRTVVETATDAVISIDEASQILLVNPATIKIFGYDSSELIGRPLTMLMPESMREPHKAGVRRYLTTEQRHMNWRGVELIGQRANGEQFPVEVSFGEIRKQGRRIFTGFIRDITDRKHAEESLRSSERELQRLVVQLERERARLVEAQEVGKIGSWEVELQSLNVTWSRETHRIFETDPSLFLPTRPKFVEFIHPDDRSKVEAALKRSLEIASSSQVGYRIVMPDGRIKFLEESWQTFYDERGKPVRLAGTCHDITERTRAEEEVRRLSGRLLRSQDEERRTIARDLHDSMGQDLVALATMLGQLHREIPSSERKTRRTLLECKSWADRCIREIRTLSYVLHPPMLDRTGLGDAIRDFVKGFTKRSGIQVELEFSPSLGRMTREIELALFRVVQESLTNIQRHSGSHEAKIRIHRNSGVTLEISDLGRGAAASAPSVREGHRFEFGVGISSMQERVKLVGGQFDIESSSRGTTIRVTVPLERNEGEKTAHSVGR